MSKKIVSLLEEFFAFTASKKITDIQINFKTIIGLIWT